MEKMNKLIFKLRFMLIPKEFRDGSWLAIGGDFLNIEDMWVKTKDGWSISIHISDKKEKHE